MNKLSTHLLLLSSLFSQAVALNLLPFSHPGDEKAPHFTLDFRTSRHAIKQQIDSYDGQQKKIFTKKSLIQGQHNTKKAIQFDKAKLKNIDDFKRMVLFKSGNQHLWQYHQRITFYVTNYRPRTPYIDARDELLNSLDQIKELTELHVAPASDDFVFCKEKKEKLVVVKKEGNRPSLAAHQSFDADTSSVTDQSSNLFWRHKKTCGSLLVFSVIVIAGGSVLYSRADLLSSSKGLIPSASKEEKE